MAHASTAESLAEQAKYIPYGPMRKSSIGIIKKGEPWFIKEGGNIDIMPHMPTHPKVLKRAVIGTRFGGLIMELKFTKDLVPGKVANNS